MENSNTVELLVSLSPFRTVKERMLKKNNTFISNTVKRTVCSQKKPRV